jgi:hypothetical protein
MRRIAASARRYGYFAAGSVLAVCCPRCRGRVEAQRNHGWMPAGKGKPYSRVIDGRPSIFRQESVTEALDRAMVAHLTHDQCQEQAT